MSRRSRRKKEKKGDRIQVFRLPFLKRSWKEVLRNQTAASNLSSTSHLVTVQNTSKVNLRSIFRPQKTQSVRPISIHGIWTDINISMKKLNISALQPVESNNIVALIRETSILVICLPILYIGQPISTRETILCPNALKC